MKASKQKPLRSIRRNSPGRRPLNGEIDAQTMSDKTKSDIITIATQEFAINGYHGASVNKIAEKTRTSKRMLYYYFGGKLKLYTAVLEGAYREMRTDISSLNSDIYESMEPMEALRDFAHHAFRMHKKNPIFVRLVMNENLNDAKVLRTSKKILNDNSGNLQSLERIVSRGQKAGVMRRNIRVIDLYLTIVGMSFYTVSNRRSIQAIFGIDLDIKRESAKRQELIGELACRYVSV